MKLSNFVRIIRLITVLHDTCSNKPQEVAAVQVARRNLPVQLPPFRAVVGSVGLYQDYKGDCSHPQDTRLNFWGL